MLFTRGDNRRAEAALRGSHSLHHSVGMRLNMRFIANLLLLGILFGATSTTLAFDDFRGLWISRFEYNEDSVVDITNRINSAADMGITDVFWQVRAKADAYYNSNFEPNAQDWQGNVDPLQTAISVANVRGVKIHAWLNTMPIWRDSTQPTDPSHVFFNTNPSFRVTDINGNVEQLVGGSSSFSGSYARINHVLPEVQDHINDVVQDIAENYDVAGIHLDYIRWLGPGDASDGFRPDWDFMPHDPLSHQLYQQATGSNGADGSTFAKREAYRDWVQSRITDLVESVGTTVDQAETTTGREIKLSAAVWNNPTTAERDYMQDYGDWLQRDLLDLAIPMVYLSQSNSNLLDGFLDDIFSNSTNTEVSIGLGTYLHSNSGGGVAETIAQMQEVYDDGRADSLTFFSYASLLDGSTLSNAREQAVIDWYNETFALEGDFNGDGNVDSADYTIWRDTFLQFGDLPADANGDGFIGNADYDIWEANFGSTASSLSTSTAVPEPSSAILLVALASSLLSVNRR